MKKKNLFIQTFGFFVVYLSLDFFLDEEVNVIEALGSVVMYFVFVLMYFLNRKLK